MKITFTADAVPTLTKSSTVRTNAVLTLESWQRAFCVFVAVYCGKYPTEVSGLLKHADTIRELASQIQGDALLIYDESFRVTKKERGLVWGQIHSELYIKASILMQPCIIRIRVDTGGGTMGIGFTNLPIPRGWIAWLATARVYIYNLLRVIT